MCIRLQKQAKKVTSVKQTQDIGKMVNKRLREELKIFSFIAGRRTTGAMFTCRLVLGKNTGDEKRCNIVSDIRKVHDRVPRNEI